MYSRAKPQEGWSPGAQQTTGVIRTLSPSLFSSSLLLEQCPVKHTSSQWLDADSHSARATSPRFLGKEADVGSGATPLVPLICWPGSHTPLLAAALPSLGVIWLSKGQHPPKRKDAEVTEEAKVPFQQSEDVPARNTPGGPVLRVIYLLLSVWSLFLASPQTAGKLAGRGDGVVGQRLPSPKSSKLWPQRNTQSSQCLCVLVH